MWRKINILSIAVESVLINTKHMASIALSNTEKLLDSFYTAEK